MPGCVPRGVTLLECNLLRPPGLIDEHPPRSPAPATILAPRPALPPIAPKIAPALAPAASNPFWYVVVGRRRRRRRGGLGGGPTRMGRRTSPSSFTTLPEAQFCGVIVPNSPFISLSGPAVK